MRVPIMKTRRWAEVEEGEDLPPLSMPITVTRCIMGVVGTRDLYGVHHDPEFARKNGARNIFVNTMFQQALFGRYLTDWGGPESFPRKLEIIMREQVCPGDTLTLTGRVTRKHEREGMKLVDIEVTGATALGEATHARATLQLVEGGEPPGRRAA